MDLYTCTVDPGARFCWLFWKRRVERHQTDRSENRVRPWLKIWRRQIGSPIMFNHWKSVKLALFPYTVYIKINKDIHLFISIIYFIHQVSMLLILLMIDKKYWAQLYCQKSVVYGGRAQLYLCNENSGLPKLLCWSHALRSDQFADTCVVFFLLVLSFEARDLSSWMGGPDI